MDKAFIHRVILIITFLVLSCTAFSMCITSPRLLQKESDTFPVQSRGNLFFSSDVLQYQGQGKRTRLDILYTVNLSKFWQNSQSSDSLLLLNIRCRLFDHESVLLSESVRKKRFTPNSEPTNQAATYIDLMQYSLVPDHYKIEITMRDSVSGAKGITEHLLKVRDFSKKFCLSDIYFIADIQKTNKKSNFEKNGYLLIPNIQRSYFNTDKEKLYIYYEINNLEFDSESQTYYHTYYSIMDLAEKEITSGLKEWHLASASGVAQIEGISVSNLQPGIYKIKVETIDVKGDRFTSNAAYFQITAPLQQYNTILPMTEADIANYLKQIRYIASDKEISIFKQLNNESKQKFLLDFWQSKDPDPSTTENEFMHEHFKRIAYTEAHFRGGIDSDIGRIYIIYGPPQDIDRDFSQMKNSKPIITWYYAMEGSVKFVFVDRTGDGIYTLVHSTKQDEYSDPDWKNRIMENN